MRAVDTDRLKKADIDEFRETMDVFAHKANFIASRVSDNTSAQADSISDRYDAYGNIFSQGASRYDYFG